MSEEEMIEEEIIEEDKTQPQSWPEDWRQRIAGDDEKALEQLGRYQSPVDVWTKARALEQKMSSGEYKQDIPFPEKGTDEEKADWLSQRGIPETSDKYELTREVEQSELEQLKPFLDFAHSNRFTPDQVNTMVDYFYSKYETDRDSLTEGDKIAQTDADDKLRVEWGDDYRGNINRVESLIDTVPALNVEGEKVPVALLDARLPDGTKLRSSPEVMQFLLRSALAINPATTVVPTGGDQAGSIVDEIEKIRETMRTDRQKYNKDERMQKRYTELLTALQQTDPQEYARISQ